MAARNGRIAFVPRTSEAWLRATEKVLEALATAAEANKLRRVGIESARDIECISKWRRIRSKKTI
jgi:hypothetical protein